MRRRQLLGVVLLTFAACDKSSTPTVQKDPPVAPSVASVPSSVATNSASAKASASAAAASLFSGRLCRDGTLIPMPSGMPYAGPMPKDDSGPFYVDGIVDGASYRYPPLAHHPIGDFPLLGADSAVCPALPAVRSCIETARKTSPSLVGALDVEIAFSKGGGVENVRVEGGSLPEAHEACLVAALKKATLASPEGTTGTTVQYRIVVQATHLKSPVVKIEEKKYDITGPITPVELKKHFRAHFPAIRRCYETALRTSPSLAGAFDVDLTIAPSSDITPLTANAKTTPGTLKSAPFLECAQKALDGMMFLEASDAGVTKAHMTLELSYARP